MHGLLLMNRHQMNCIAWQTRRIAGTCHIVIVCRSALQWHMLRVACTQVLCVAWGNGLRSTISPGTANTFFINLQTSETEQSNYGDVYDGDMVSYIVQPPSVPSFGPSASN